MEPDTVNSVNPLLKSGGLPTPLLKEEDKWAAQLAVELLYRVTQEWENHRRPNEEAVE